MVVRGRLVIGSDGMDEEEDVHLKELELLHPITGRKVLLRNRLNSGKKLTRHEMDELFLEGD